MVGDEAAGGVGRVVVVGLGAIGGTVAGRLATAGVPVVGIARGGHGGRVAKDGLLLRSPAGDAVVRFPVVGSVAEAAIGPDDVVLIAVKSQDTGPLVERLAAVAPPEVPVVCLQNGVANEPTVLRVFPHTYAGVVMCPAAHLEPGVVVHYSTPIPGLFDLGPYPAGSDPLVDAIATTLRRGGFDCEVRADVMRWKWRKLIGNLANAVEALCGTGPRTDALVQGAQQEADEVLAAAGIEVASGAEDRARRKDLLAVGPVDGNARPGASTWQSLARGAAPETDYLNGEIVLLGRLHGIATPVNETLQHLVREVAATSTRPGLMDPAQIATRAASLDRT